MRLPTPLLATLLALVSFAAAATTAALDPLRDEVLSRRAANPLATLVDRIEYRALGRIGHFLATPTTTLAEDLRVAARVGHFVSRDFRLDPELGALFADGADRLAAAAASERDRLALWTGRTGDVMHDAALGEALTGIRERFARAASRKGDVGRLRLLRRACTAIDATRAELALVGDPPVAPPNPVMSDFALADVNPNSATSGHDVSPRQFLGKLSAWYFGKAG